MTQNKIRPITMDELDFLGLDKENNIYWKNEKIQVQQKIKLSFWQSVLGILAAIGALSSGVVDIISLVKNW